MAAVAALATASLHAQTPAPPGGEADLVLLNGKIFVGDSAGSIVQAIAVRDGRIVVSGSSEQARRVAGERTRVIDLHGGFVTPGFNDAHVHLASGGGALLAVDLTGVTSTAEMERRVRDAAAKAAPGEWILGRGWDQTRLPASELGPGGWPTRAVLDRAAPNNPVVLTRVDGHTSWVNTAALRLAGIDRATQSPAGGEIVRDAAGEATGILKEDPARNLVTSKVPPPSPTQIRRQILAAMQYAVSTGVTSVQSDVSPIVAGSSADDSPALPDAFRVYQDLRRADSLNVRVYAWFPLDRAVIESFRRLGIRAGFGDEWLRLGMVKGYTDGTLGSRTAYMLQPFSDDPHTHGLPRYTQAKLDSLVAEADAAGLQVILHAIGDAANRQALDAIERAERANPAHERRHRIEHAQVLAPEDIPRFRQLGVIASMQPTHATSDLRWAEQRIGHQRAVQGAYAWRSLLNAGATVIFGTDFPVEPIRPVEGIYSAVTRQSREHPGEPPGGWMPEQKLTRVEAIHLYTAAPAYGEWQERVKGMLRPGMLADFVVWSADLLTIPEREILNAEPLMTVVGGRTVYQKP
ncbi:MAG TPA: amidohydrolase [Longimicrobium sp.]|nr:amidohydrolase [Longimicrobium sp.]